MKRIALIALIALFAASCTKVPHYDTVDQMVAEAAKHVRMITPDSLHALMNGEETYTLIDVRQELEYYYGFIPGSINIPRGSIEFSISDSTFWEKTGLYMPARDEKIVVYCKKGQRGILVAESLSKLGYTNVWVLEGGWKNWERSYPDIYEKDLEKLGGGHETPKSSGGGGC